MRVAAVSVLFESRCSIGLSYSPQSGARARRVPEALSEGCEGSFGRAFGMSGAAPSRSGAHLGTFSPVMREFRGRPDCWSIMEIRRPAHNATAHCGFCGAARCPFCRSHCLLLVLISLSSESTLCIVRAVTNFAISIIRPYDLITLPLGHGEHSD